MEPAGWVVKGVRSQMDEGDWTAWLRPGHRGVWYTRKRLRLIEEATPAFFFKGAPDSVLVAEGRFTGAQKTNRTGETSVGLVVDRVYDVPLHQSAMRADAVLADAPFLKQGPVGTFYPLTAEQVARLHEINAPSRQRATSLLYPAEDGSLLITTEMYRAAIRALGGLRPGEQDLLRSLYVRRERSSTAPALADAMGYAGHGPANARLGRLGHRLADALGMKPAGEWWPFVANGRVEATGFVWTLKPELTAALIAEGLIEEGDASDPQEDLEPTADPAVLEARTRRLLARGHLAKPKGEERPRRVQVVGERMSFLRSAAVHAFALQAAAGRCESCSQAAPFVGKAGAPYLEVHHVVTLAEGGPDTVENTVALCPNCHRRLHHSEDADAYRARLYETVRRLRLPP